MNAKDAIRYQLTATSGMVGMFLADLSDADLLTRPAPKANHIAWQLGHLINSERGLAASIPGAAYPDLPAGFAERHSNDTAHVDPPTGFGTKAEYLDLHNKTRAATLAALDNLPDADLDKATTGRMASFAPTIGALFLLISNHDMMHAGQFTVARRKLGKPVLF